MSLTAPTAVVAEDESALREELVEQLDKLWPELSVVGEAADGLEALRLLDQQRPDILFLDIEMPGATGIDVARQVAGRAHVVFVTAYDQYAIAAFDQGAVDYLLKPLNGARLFTAITRLKARLGQAPAPLGSVLEQLGARPEPSAARAPLRWINASVGQTLRLITVDEVMFFQSDNKYTRLALKDGEALIRKPLKELIDELDPQQFWQIHRSTLVNVNAVASVSRDFRGRMQIKLKHGSEMLLVAESCAHLFRQM
ncbi:MAG: response regulator transcription factor [Rubrivivax sp.]|nr:MAG: response regulator transcription factor [Rubrivivax sp.]